MALFGKGDEGEPSIAAMRLARLFGLDAPSPRGWVPAQPAASKPPVMPVPSTPTAPAIRVRASREALVWLLVVGLAVLLVAGYLMSRRSGATGDAGATGGGRAGGSAAGSLPVPSVAPLQVVVDVAGAVRHPGLVTLPQGSRVADAVRAAGGPLHARDLVGINLAARVADGQLLLVGIVGGSSSPGGTMAGSGPLDLNSATVDQLDALPGVGPVLAQRIVAWRDAHGGFRSVDDLRQVTGIGPSKYDDLKALVAV